MTSQREGYRANARGNDESTFVELSDEYTIRWYEDADREAFLELFELGFTSGSQEWFAWKYESNPYADRVPVIVAEKAGEIAAIRPFLPLPLRLGERTVSVLQPVDLVVHPDHRRKGLMMTVTKAMKGGLWDDYAATFTFATPPARDGIMKLTDVPWPTHDLGEFVKYERFNDPSPLFSTRSRALQLGSRALTPVYRGIRRFRDRFTTGDPDVTVTRLNSVPVSVLADLYEQSPPEKAHVPRDETFCAWRYDEPGWEFVTYVAHRDDTPVAAIVVGQQRTGEQTSKAHLLEVLPNDDGSLAPVFSSLLSRITADYAATSQLYAADGAIPHDTLAAHGFMRTDEFPLSRFVQPSYLVVSVLGELEDDEEALALLVRQGGWETPQCVRMLG